MSQTIQLLAGAPQEFYGVCNFLRILEASAPLTLEFYDQGREVAEAVNVGEGYAEKFEVGNFDRVRLSSSVNQQVQFVTRLGNSVLYDKAPVGDINIVGAIPLSLGVSTLQEMKRPMGYGAAFSSVALLGNLATEQVFAPGANVAGAIIHAASWTGFNSANIAVSQSSLIAAAAAPGSFTGGDVLMQIENSVPLGGGIYYSGKLQSPIFVPAGRGLWFYNAVVEVASGRRVLYTLL